MRFQDSWQAVWEQFGLHVSGMTDLFPDDFSVAGLRLDADDAHTGTRTYRLELFRDKEHFCDADLVGPVHHYERSFPAKLRRIRVVSPDGVEIGACPVPPRSNGIS